jgi:hypothetical protein
MSTCKTCGKPTRKGLNFCSQECREKAKDERYQHIYETQPKSTLTPQENKLFISQFNKGFGSARRETNIRQIIRLLESGTSEDEIRFQLSMYFRPVTIDDYIKTAKEWRRRLSG